MEEDLINKLRKGDSAALKYVYQKCFPRKGNFITSNSGTMQDAQDFFQQAMMILIEKIRRKPDFTLSTLICRYLNGIVSKIWLNHLRTEKKKEGLGFIKIQDLDDETVKELDAATTAYFDSPNDEQTKARHKIFETLSKDCQELLKAHYVHRMSWKEVAEEFGQTYGSIRVTGTRCIQKYNAMIKEAGL